MIYTYKCIDLGGNIYNSKCVQAQGLKLGENTDNQNEAQHGIPAPTMTLLQPFPFPMPGIQASEPGHANVEHMQGPC